MTKSLFTATTIGGAIGLTISAALFFTVPVYHDYFVWTWSHPWLLALGIPLGIIAGIVTD
jgi:hypothetical protein